ncbi:MIT domain-containing protein 1-like isoform X2 [Lycorma delicatula]|uniref:MIT domain-containing protein 1-like isoform X2 n=1 Tax=Lycorma delicatula TaxID=130591 RepID=UPI003F517636
MGAESSKREINNAEKKRYVRSKIETYMDRAETLKTHIQTEKTKGTFHEKIEIANNSTGHSYSSVFGRFLDNEVVAIDIEDPYIRAYHQVQNFLCACELFVKNCKNLKCISLLTTEDGNNDQKEWLEKIALDLVTKFNIQLLVQYSSTLHDRQIRLSNGWVIKIGRGLDYFKARESKFSLGTHDLDLRLCHETVVDVYYMKCN